MVIDEVGVTYMEEEEDIHRVFVNYFSDIFIAMSNLEMEEALGTVERKVTDEMLSTLSQPLMEEEVTKVLF